VELVSYYGVVMKVQGSDVEFCLTFI